MRETHHPPYRLPVLPMSGGSAVFPTRQVYGTALNCLAHALEMGRDPRQNPPFFFMKSVDAVCTPGQCIHYPPMSSNVQVEVELVVAIGRRTSEVAVEEALDHVFGYAIGLDLTRRDLEQEARRAGRPWELGKSFPGSAVIGPVHAASEVGHPDTGVMWLDSNDVAAQRGDLSQLLWSVAEQIAFLSNYYTLHEGDLLMTGAPSGTTALAPGDRVQAGIVGLGEISMVMGERQPSLRRPNLES